MSVGLAVFVTCVLQDVRCESVLGNQQEEDSVSMSSSLTGVSARSVSNPPRSTEGLQLQQPSVGFRAGLMSSYGLHTVTHLQLMVIAQ